MIKLDFHIHSNFCDGKNSAEEMILSAIEKGLDTVGICCHSYTFFDLTYCIKENDESRFQQEISRLKQKYADKIKVLCGVEQDYYSTTSTDGFDYVIGSVHYLKVEDKYYSVDHKTEVLKENVRNGFDGDFYAAAESYFSTVADVVCKTGADIIGHFDLISKFNENDLLFDSDNPRYIAAWKSAVDKLVLSGKPFEINLGGIARGIKTQPYPSLEMIKYIKEKGGKFILSSDAHKKENVAFCFSDYERFI
ncbi:MAG: histidinol-phosphatase [Clostridia bacterium]|nr:histidinol-phosphatase [Clostridia bacterium]